MNDRSTPQGAPESAAKLTASSLPATPLLSLTERQWTLWLEGYQCGRVSGLDDGYARGYEACDDELSRLQREAHKVVMLMAGLDDHETARAKQRARQISAADRIAAQVKAVGSW